MLIRFLLILLITCFPAFGQLDFHETFEGGVCDETWPTVGCPTTIVNAATMTGSYYLNPGVDVTQFTETGLAAGEVWHEIQVRIDGDPVANSFFFRVQDSSSVVQCGIFVNSAELLRITNTGGTTTSTPTTLSLDTNYKIEVRAKKGTGANAECAVRVNGGSWTTVTDGTWTANSDRGEIADVSAANFFFDEVKRCAAGSIGDGVCDEPPEPVAPIVDVPISNCRCSGLYDVPQQILPDGQESEIYPTTPLIVVGGVTPRNWEIASGALPGGLALSAACSDSEATECTIEGTLDVATAGTHNFVVKVTDADGALAYRQITIIVQIAAESGAFSQFEDSEDEVLDFVTAGDCAITNTQILDGSFEVTKTDVDDCVVVDSEDLAQVYVGFDTKNAAPTNRQWKTVLGLGTAGAELFQVIRNNNGGIHAKTAGQTGQETGGVPRGFYLGRPEPIADADSNAYVELHYIPGTGVNATFEARLNGGTIQTFSAGTATENFAKLVFRDANDAAADFVYDRVEVKDADWPGRGQLPIAETDTTPPTVLSTVPITSATGVGLSSDIQVTFSEIMDVATITDVTFTLNGGGAVAGVVTYSGTTATFNPNSNLAGTTVYTATITTGAEDVAGNAIAAQYQWTFTTGAGSDVTAPTVSSVIPLDNATGVAITQILTVNFSEAMDPASITTASFTLARGATPITGTVNFSGSSATFTPTASLATNSSHLATITTTAQDLAGNNLASNFTWDFTTAGAPVTPPWMTNFIPERIHYVSASGSGVGTIGDPESFSTARTHYVCGDLHTYRGGTYLNSGAEAIFSRVCNSSAPAVFKGYVNPANGQPENVEWKFGVPNPGRWNWFVNIHRNTIGVTPTGDRVGFTLRQGGTRIINSVVHDVGASTIGAFRNSGANEPGQVLYGNITYRTGFESTDAPHNFYVQNDWAAQGYKYFTQNISLEPSGVPGGTTEGRRLFQVNDSHGDRGISGIWLEKNFLGDASNSPVGHTIVFNSSQSVAPWPAASKTVMKDNVFADFFHNSSELRSVKTQNVSMQGVITGNYFAKTNFAIDGYWGNQGTRDPWIFTGNEIYDPPGGVHLPVFQTRKENGAASGADGSFKIPNADIWNNNTYGGTFVAEIFCNGLNSGTSTLAQWRDRTDNCRVTPSGTNANGFDLSSTNPANPTTAYIEIHQNEYQCPTCVFTDQDRGNIYVVNWALASAVTVDISSVVGPNKFFNVRYPRDFFGSVAATGICPSAGACNVSLPTRRTSAEASGKFANAYVITAQP